MQATAKIFFQTAPTKKTTDDLCPVKLCVTHQRQRKYYSIREKLTKDDWQFIANNDITEKLYRTNEKGQPLGPVSGFKERKKDYDRIAREAEDAIAEIEVFSFGQFEERFFNRAGSWDSVIPAMIDHIQGLKSDGRFGYASSFESTLRAVAEYVEKRPFHFKASMKVEERYNYYLKAKRLQFRDITGQWLKNFEAHLKRSGKSRSTIGIYIRNLRVLFNIAINEKKVKAEYPFKKHKIKGAQGRKIALSASQIRMIANYETVIPQEKFYRDMFMFSFLGNGINLSDIARLRYSDYDGDEMSFVREKTKGKDKEVKLRFAVTGSLRKIIKEHGTPAVGFDGYMFPILQPGWTEERKYAEIKQFTKQLNKYIRRIASALKIQDPVSSYTARHSWATIAKNSGASVEYIKEHLGHSSVLVTELYLDSFEKSTRREQSEKTESLIYDQNAG